MSPPSRPKRAWPYVLVALLVVAALLAATVLFVRRLQQQREARAAEQRELETRLTESSTADATADLVDADFLFTLKWPGTGFKLAGEADARRLGSDAVAMAMHERGCSISVIAEHIPGATAEEVARQLIDGTSALKKTEQVFETSTLHGFPAHHYKMTGEMAGVPFDFDNIVVARGEWFFQVLRTRPAMSPSACDIPPETIVTFQEGTIKGRTPVVLPTEENRPLYREKNGLFESPTFGLRLQAPPGAQLMIGDEAVDFDPEAAVVVIDKSSSVALSTVPICGDPAPTIQAGQNASVAAQFSLQLPERPTHQVKVGDRQIELYEMSGPPPYTTMLGSAVFGDRLLLLRATYAKRGESTGIDLVQRTAAGLAMLDQSDADAITRDLPARDPARVVRLGRSLRGGQYVDYEHGLRADLGDEPTQPNLDMEADGVGGKSALGIRRPRWGIDTLVLVAPPAGRDLAGEHKALAVTLLGATDADVTVEPGAGPKNTKIGYDSQLGVRGRVDLSTIEGGGKRVHVVTWGTKSCVERAATSTAKLVSGIKIEPGPIEEVELTPRRLKNDRFGFELLLPDGEWKQSVMTLPPAVASVMSGYELRSGGNMVAVLALHNDTTRDPDFIVALLEQLFASKIAQRREAVERSDLRVAGVMGRRLKWSDRISAAIVADGGTYFVVMVERAVVGGVDADKVFGGFAITR
ncbi:MAG: hypothetical protein JNK04_15955 [Myxococcales bacterium]|nr:hypothetical protein [Myxococcales bacterium]